MMIGAYFKDGRCLVAPLPEASQRLGISEHIIKQALEGKHVLRNVTLVKLPNDAVPRTPKESFRIK